MPGLLPALWLLGEDDPAADRPSEDLHAAARPSGEPEGLASIHLLPPVGDSPRTRPLQTLWIIAEDAVDDESAAAAVAHETRAAVAHMSRWAAPGDGLAISEHRLRRLRADVEILVPQASEPVTRRLEDGAAIAEAESALAAHADDHTAIVVVADADSGPASAAAAAFDRHPPARGAATPRAVDDDSPTHARSVVSLGSGTGRPASLDSDEPLPSRLTVDIQQRGQLAEALARIYVETYGGGWQIPH